MDTTVKNNQPEIKSTLLTLWVFVFFNMIFRDLHELGRPGMIQEIMTGIVNGVQITDALLLIGGVMIEIPLLMLPVTQLSNLKTSRLANLWVSALLIPLMVFNYNLADPDDVFFLVFETAALLLIIWNAWHWSDPTNSSRQNIR